MRQADLDAVREASRREREHAAVNKRDGFGDLCTCLRCLSDRRNIAEHAPALLALLADALAIPRREHHDLGDLD